jgi:hypothetical protein
LLNAACEAIVRCIVQLGGRMIMRSKFDQQIPKVVGQLDHESRLGTNRIGICSRE